MANLKKKLLSLIFDYMGYSPLEFLLFLELQPFFLFLANVLGKFLIKLNNSYSAQVVKFGIYLDEELLLHN